MRAFALLSLLAVGCAAAPVRPGRPELARSAPAAAVHRMALGALPTYHLRSMLLGVNPPADQVLNSQTDADHTLGWINNGYPATGGSGGHVDRYAFGDLGSAFQSATGARLQIYAYHGVVVIGGRASLTPPASVAGSGSSDFSLQVIGSTGGGIFTDGVSSFTAGLTAASMGISSSLLAPVVTATSSGATTNQQGIEVGVAVLVGGTKAVTFSPAFTTSAPVCTCTDITAAAAPKCPATTTTLTITGTTTDSINWICVGRK